jgi:2-dehydropantoate 2-reductase
MNQVAIVGPGALGCLFTLRLMQAGVMVTLVDYRHERRTFLQEKGIQVETEGHQKTVHPLLAAQVPEGMDLVIVLTKTGALDSLLLPQNTPILTLQNGLGVVDKLARLTQKKWILAGTTTEAATLLAPGHVRHAASGITAFGSIAGCPAEAVQTLFHQAGFDSVLVDNPEEVRWQKALLSAAINPLTALLSVSNGKLLDSRESRSLLASLVSEGLTVARQLGYCQDFDAWAEAEMLCHRTSSNFSSMYQDVQRGNPTEIEMLSGALLSYARSLNLKLPATTLLYRLIRSLEKQ